MAKPIRLGDKRYRIVYDVPPRNGRPRQQKRETLNGVTRQEAEAILAERKALIKGGECAAELGLKMAALFDQFMTKKAKRLEATTRQRYQSLLRTYLKPSFGHLQAASLKKAHIIEAIDDWQSFETKPGGRTIRHAFDLLRATLNWAVKLDLVPFNVATKISPEDLPKAPKPEIIGLTTSELLKLIVEAKNPTHVAAKRGTLSSEAFFHPAVVFAAHTGARRGEVLALRWRDLDLDLQQVTIRESLSEAEGRLTFKRPKNGNVRPISMDDELVRVLRHHRARQNEDRLYFGSAYQDDDLVFARADGSPVRPWSLGAAFAELVRRAGVTRISFHGLRDTHASLLAEAEVPIEVVSRRLGHSTIAITVDRYIAVYRKRDAAASSDFWQHLKKETASEPCDTNVTVRLEIAV